MDFKTKTCILWGAVRQNTGNEFILPDEIACLRELVQQAIDKHEKDFPSVYSVSPVKRIVQLSVKEITE